MKWKNDIQKRRKNNSIMKYSNFKYNGHVNNVASILTLILIVLCSKCLAKDTIADTQTVQLQNKKWQDIQKNTTEESPHPQRTAATAIAAERNSLQIKSNKDDIAFINKPTKFDEHVEEEQYVDNPLLLLKMNATKTSSLQATNVTKTLSSTTSANKTTISNINNEYRLCNNDSSSAAAGTVNSTMKKCDRLSGGQSSTISSTKLLNVDMIDNNDQRNSAVVRKRNSIGNESLGESNLQELSYSKPNPSTIFYYSKPFEYKNTTKRWPSSGSITRYPKAARMLLDTTKHSYRKYPAAGLAGDGSALLSFKLKKETENYRTLEKRIRRRNRVRRSLLQLPFNEVVYRPIHRRYYLQRDNDRIDLWDQYDQHRRYVRFPLGIGGGGGSGSDIFRNAPPSNRPPPPPPPPPAATAIWSPQQIPQYAAYQQSLPPVPSMGPRSPRLVFRDPVEPGTLQAPFSPNGLQDLTSPEDNRDDWPVETEDGNDNNRLCPTGSCEFFLTCWMSSGLIEGACGGGFLYACCMRNSGKATDRGASSISTNDLQLPSNYGPVINDPRCGVSVAKQQSAQRRIVGGDEAGFGSFPWQAYIRIGSSRCGGTLVNRFHVVTAGHCVARATARQVQVTLGDYVINSAVEPLPAYTFGVRKINVHPYFKFTPQADRFDVAVLRLDRPVQYMPHIAPICLPEKDEDFLGQYGWAAGWGALQAGSRLRPKTLQAVDVPIIDNRQCERWHKSNGINVVIYEEMMCAGYRGGSKDSCQGDSGGPLMLEKTGRWYLIGIVSAGYSCAQRGQPGIYHRVAHTVDWISYVMNS